MERERMSIESGGGEFREAPMGGAGSGKVAVTQEGADELRRLAFELDASFNSAMNANARLLKDAMPLLEVDIQMMRDIRDCVVDNTNQLKKSTESMAFLCLRLCNLADKIEGFLQKMGSSAMLVAAVSGAIGAAAATAGTNNAAPGMHAVSKGANPGQGGPGSQAQHDAELQAMFDPRMQHTTDAKHHTRAGSNSSGNQGAPAGLDTSPASGFDLGGAPAQPSGARTELEQMFGAEVRRPAQANPTGPAAVPAYSGANHFDYHAYDGVYNDFVKGFNSSYALEPSAHGGDIAMVDARRIVGARFFDDQSMAENDFWTQKSLPGATASQEYARFGELASHVPEVKARLDAGESYENLANDPVLGQTAQLYFGKQHIIQVYQFGNTFLFKGDGRHRVCIAQDMDLHIPVMITHYVRPV